MNVNAVLFLLGLSIAGQAQADTRAGVWLRLDAADNYRSEHRAYQYAPRSPYLQHRALPPPARGRVLPPQYYEKHRRFDRHQHWRDDRQAERYFQRPPIRDDRDYRIQRYRDERYRSYRR